MRQTSYECSALLCSALLCFALHSWGVAFKPEDAAGCCRIPCRDGFPKRLTQARPGQNGRSSATFYLQKKSILRYMIRQGENLCQRSGQVLPTDPDDPSHQHHFSDSVEGNKLKRVAVFLGEAKSSQAWAQFDLPRQPSLPKSLAATDSTARGSTVSSRLNLLAHDPSKVVIQYRGSLSCSSEKSAHGTKWKFIGSSNEEHEA
ncbi:hypothetical protein BJ878DRAFT_478014 [Calycina marina]|uniref:Secreted protein n=1 Tax=Calycina marina TaxID=1763456 RepID=A0A9P7Z7M0_9HELO|nr:hypothetical protein BJ878DRAFT_478014 [Calycina marina]